jgi:ribosome-associated translation inhibitor RaiA
MENLSKVLATLENATLKLSGEKLNQVQRNAFKSDLLNALVNDLVSLGLQATITSDGVVVMVENDTTNLYINLDATIKNLDFDLDSAKQEYQAKQEAKLEREALAKAKREKLAKDKATKIKKS